MFGEVQVGAPSNNELWVLLHGWGRSLNDFDAFCVSASKMAEPPWIVKFDLPGFGSSPVPTESISTMDYAKMVSDAVDEVVLSIPGREKLRVVVVGHSFGGSVAISLGTLSGTHFRLSALLISGSPLLRLAQLARRPKLSFRIIKGTARLGLIPMERLEKAKVRYGSRDYREAQGVMRDIFVRVVNEDYGHLLQEISLPVSLVWGRQDTAAPLLIAERAVELAPQHISLKIVEGDHFVVISSPSTLLDSVTELIQRIEP